MDADLVVTHAQVATLIGPDGPRSAGPAGEIDLRADHAVACRDGRITWVGPTQEWDGEAATTLDASGRLVTPGYVDSHTHLVYGGDRAFEIGMKLAGKQYLEILAAGGGIAHTVGATRALDEAGLVEQALPRLRRMLANGTTTLESKGGYGLDTETELRMLAANPDLSAATGQRIESTFLGAHAIAPEYADDPDGYVDHIVDEMMPAAANQGIARFCDAFVEKDVFTYDHGEAIFEAAKRHGLQPRLHADEIVNTRGAELAAASDCISADHLLRVSEEGIAAMADAGTIATLLPTVPITLMQPEWAPGKRFLESGVPVALASDHNPNNPVTDMGLVCQLGAYLLGLSPAQALTAATWNGACALGVESDVGSIEVGKQADLLVHNVTDLDHWVYEIGRKTVDAVVLGGAAVTS